MLINNLGRSEFFWSRGPRENCASTTLTVDGRWPVRSTVDCGGMNQPATVVTRSFVSPGVLFPHRLLDHESGPTLPHRLAHVFDISPPLSWSWVASWFCLDTPWVLSSMWRPSARPHAYNRTEASCFVVTRSQVRPVSYHNDLEGACHWDIK